MNVRIRVSVAEGIVGKPLISPFFSWLTYFLLLRILSTVELYHGFGLLLAAGPAARAGGEGGAEGG